MGFPSILGKTLNDQAQIRVCIGGWVIYHFAPFNLFKAFFHFPNTELNTPCKGNLSNDAVTEVGSICTSNRNRTFGPA